MKYKRLFVFLLCWECFVWLVFNNHLFRTQIWILFTEKQIYEYFYLGGNYFDIEVYLLVLAVTSVIAVEYALKHEGIQVLMRYSLRHRFFTKRIQTVVLCSFIYVLIHFALAFGASLLIFQSEYVLNKPTALFYGSSMLIVLIFFIRVNLIYILLRDLFSKKVFAMGTILVIYILEFYLGYHFLSDFWFPCKDLSAGILTYMGRMGIIEMIISLLRQGGMTVVVAMVAMRIFSRKDVIEIEK